MALRLCNNWRYNLYQITRKVEVKSLLIPKTQNRLEARSYRNLSFGDYKVGLSEKIYLWSIPIMIFITIIDKEKIRRIIRGEDMDAKYNAEELAAVFPNAQIVVTVVEKDPEDTHSEKSS